MCCISPGMADARGRKRPRHDWWQPYTAYNPAIPLYAAQVEKLQRRRKWSVLPITVNSAGRKRRRENLKVSNRKI